MLMAISAIIAVAYDIIFTNRYLSHSGSEVSASDYRHATGLLVLGAAICLSSLKTPRLLLLSCPLVVLLFVINTLSGFSLTTPHYLDRPGPHYPLQDFPWAFGRIIPIFILCWTLVAVLLTLGVPLIWKKFTSSKKFHRESIAEQAGASDGDKPPC